VDCRKGFGLAARRFVTAHNAGSAVTDTLADIRQLVENG
jgi:hypothetical protein